MGPAPALVRLPGPEGMRLPCLLGVSFLKLHIFSQAPFMSLNSQSLWPSWLHLASATILALAPELLWSRAFCSYLPAPSAAGHGLHMLPECAVASRYGVTAWSIPCLLPSPQVPFFLSVFPNSHHPLKPCPRATPSRQPTLTS